MSQPIRWGIAGRMGLAWLITLPSAGLVAAVLWFVAHVLGAWAVPLAIVAIMGLMALAMWRHSLRAPVDHSNVDDEWVPASTAELPEPDKVGAP